jgi:NADP-dependent 3-hydroxy acid dehydrogenase YdfG
MSTTGTVNQTESKALIVGANGGIGSAIAVAMARQGIDTALVGRNESAIKRVADDCSSAGARSIPLLCDISQTDSIKATVDSAIEQLGGLNYLVNCAGISADGKLHEGDLLSSEKILATNLTAHLYFSRYALPEINRQSGGAVIKIGAVDHSYAGVNTYLAANRGVEGLAAAMFEDVREYGTRVCTIKPGWVNTSLVADEDGIDPMLMIQPDDVAQTVLFVISLPQTVCPTEITLLPQRSPYI